LLIVLICIIVDAYVIHDHGGWRATDMYVCVCNAVTDGDIRAAASRGVCSMEALGDQLKVATCCGRCLDHARKVLFQAMSDDGGDNRHGA
jgi:bacterioferritin-associated ferredoxin